MDIVEEFLEITKAVPCQQHICECESTKKSEGAALCRDGTEVNIKALMQMFLVLRKRIPPRYLPKLVRRH